MSDESLIDDAAIERLREWGGDKLIREMVRLYLENASVRLGQIDEGLAEPGRIDAAELGAHSLKSSALNVGARNVSRIAAEIEACASADDRAGAARLRDPLVQELDAARLALTRLVEGLLS
jgi:HPt (histidine-containing phosphotransfer) domain-containing protein